MQQSAFPSSSAATLNCFAPVLDQHIHTLILGSFPGVASLDAQQYYAHPRNQFWRLLSEVIEDDLPLLSYEDKLARLLAHHIGLWDVIGQCERKGSLDSAIKHATHNQFDLLNTHAPRLTRICFNGKTAGKAAPVFAQAGYETLILPSSSPANAQLSFEEKRLQWLAIRR
jgi:hypoxanthine-DNA glycosylase